MCRSCCRHRVGECVTDFKVAMQTGGRGAAEIGVARQTIECAGCNYGVGLPGPGDVT